MSEEQERKECRKAIKGLRARLKRWWENLPTSFQIIYSFCIILGPAAFTWFKLGPEFAIFVVGVFGGLLMFFRIVVSTRRTTAAINEAKAAENRNRDERFKNAIENLGHESVSKRLSGIYELHHIAQDVEEYRDRVFEILCAHIQETTTQEAYKPRIIEPAGEEPTIEIQKVLDLLFIKTPGREIYRGLVAKLGKAYLKGAQLVDAYLENADFNFAILDDANLSNSNLRGAILFKVSLQEANLDSADLQKANLQWSELKNSNLSNANLHWVNLKEANLQEANLPNANLQYVELKGANLQETILRMSELKGSRLDKADLRKANLQGANLQGTDLRKANLQGANLQGTDLQQANFQKAKLQKADFQGADLIEADLIDAKDLEVEQLLKVKTLYKAKLPDRIEDAIKQQKPEFLEKLNGEKDAKLADPQRRHQGVWAGALSYFRVGRKGRLWRSG